MSVRPVRSQSSFGSPVRLSKSKTARERRSSWEAAGARLRSQNPTAATTTRTAAAIAAGAAHRRRFPAAAAAASFRRPVVVAISSSPVSRSRFRSSRSRRRSLADW